MKIKVISFLFFCLFICGLAATLTLFRSISPTDIFPFVFMAISLIVFFSGFFYWLFFLALRYRLENIELQTLLSVTKASLVCSFLTVGVLFLSANNQLSWPIFIVLLIMAIIILLILKRRPTVG